MKINTIEKKQGTTFGYNQNLNKQVINILTKDSSDLNKKLIQLNVFCNKTEDLIDLNNQNEVKAAENIALIDVFLNIKNSFAKALDYYFPSLDYSAKEAKNYQKESKIKIKDWKSEIAEMLKPKKIEKQSEELGTHEKVNILCVEPNEKSPKGISGILGREKLKKEILDKIIYPLKNPEKALADEKDYGCTYPKSILLSGPDGCNKGLIAEAIAREADLLYFKINIDYNNIQPTEKNITQPEFAIEMLSHMSKQTGKPCVLNLDGFNNLFPKKDSGEVLLSSTERNIERLIESIKKAKEKNVLIVSTVEKLDQGNRIDNLVKYGFGSHFEVGLPDRTTIVENLKKNLSQKIKGEKLLNSKEDLSAIAEKINKAGFTDKDIRTISDNAAIIARDNNRSEISKEHYFEAIQQNSGLIQSTHARVAGFGG